MQCERADVSGTVHRCARAMTASFCKSLHTFINRAHDEYEERMKDPAQAIANSLHYVFGELETGFDPIVCSFHSGQHVDAVYEPRIEGLFSVFAQRIGYVPRGQLLRRMEPYKYPRDYKPGTNTKNLFEDTIKALCTLVQQGRAFHFQLRVFL